jgi:hypothetical protein
MTSINDGRGKTTPIHSMFENFIGINFLGKLHNTKQHIQFIQFIKDDIALPTHVLPGFLTSFNVMTCGHYCENHSLLPIKKENLKTQFDECEWYMFEICSLKKYEKDGFQVQYEHTNDFNYSEQTEEELLTDLHKIRNLIPLHKNILFQVHFRPNIIYQDPNRVIHKREVIYNVVSAFCQLYDHTFLHDPSTLIQTNISLYDGDTHFTPKGLLENFNHIHANYLQKN